MEKNNIRTDLAIENKECYKGTNTEIPGVSLTKEYDDENNIEIVNVEILNASGADAMRKPIGKYITLESQEMLYEDSQFHLILSQYISRYISELMPEKDRPVILVCGLGNHDITPDALGPKVIDNINVTRHIFIDYMDDGLDEINSRGVVSAFVPGVLGKTGMEAGESIKAMVDIVKPDVIVVVDALAARKIARLGTTIQITNVGIVPGSGVANSRKEINEKSMGVPVIAIGVPTVIAGATIVFDAMSEFASGEDVDKLQEMIDPHLGTMYLTPNDIDQIVTLISKTVADGINGVFYKESENIL